MTRYQLLLISTMLFSGLITATLLTAINSASVGSQPQVERLNIAIQKPNTSGFIDPVWHPCDVACQSRQNVKQPAVQQYAI
ncbi:hypothetical protein Q7C_913 [Methylophaga frappieri]|uniref:Uncharacterized protein n=1 Tax=Methylophaga frappieri (strain ATCC BAA-2434 / DSM 25690 / JAM7) TaxID=754477 RepID=I1YGN9_METFJ|nr:hypothetical protein [Methylophaga frappieri]AFJ02082.1 hypothetical protein Q7C_913 [Methylophaga frappieri]